MCITNYTHLTISERQLIDQMLQEKYSLTEIANELGRNKSTISREIERNKHRDMETVDDFRNINRAKSVYTSNPYYCAYVANSIMAERAKNSHKPYKIKSWVKAYIVEELKNSRTPEQISGWFRVHYYFSISVETIYRFVYSDEGRADKLWEYLVRAHNKRKKKKKLNNHQSNISRRTSISERPECINNREEFGHWEGDSVESPRGHSAAINTMRERKTRFLASTKVPNLTSLEGVNAQKRLLGNLPPFVRKTITLDNGREFHNHHELIDELGMQTYFCHPYSSWEKGSIENGNGLIRRTYPKGTDFNDVSEDELQDTIWRINNIPMKCLGWKTPWEAFQEEIRKENAKSLVVAVAA